MTRRFPACSPGIRQPVSASPVNSAIRRSGAVGEGAVEQLHRALDPRTDQREPPGHRGPAQTQRTRPADERRGQRVGGQLGRAEVELPAEPATRRRPRCGTSTAAARRARGGDGGRSPARSVHDSGGHRARHLGGRPARRAPAAPPSASSAHDVTSGRARSSARRCRSVIPPHTPNSTRWSSACARHSVRTGHVRQKPRASRWRAPRHEQPVRVGRPAPCRHAPVRPARHPRAPLVVVPPRRRVRHPTDGCCGARGSTEHPADLLNRRTRSRTDTVQTPVRVPWSIVKAPRHLLRPVGMLLALCVLAGVLVAGMAFPGALALGLVSNEAGDSVNSVSTDLATGQLPQTSTITDSAGEPDRLPVRPEPRPGARRPDLARDEGRDRRDRGPALLPAPGRRLAGHDPRGGGELGVRRRRAGRLDADPAVRQELPALRRGGDRGRAAQGHRADARPQAARGADRAADGAVADQGGDPRPLPQHRLLGQRRVRHLGGGPHLLRHHGRTS